MSDPRPGHQLAQLNIALLKAPLSDPSMEGFTSQLEPINRMAEKSPGFVWRLIDDEGENATDLRPFGEEYLVNCSVWEDLESLWDFTYRTDHLELLRGRRQWFDRMDGPHLALWWIPSGTIPSVEEAGRRLDLVREHGPSPEAFTLRTHFPPPSTP
ncbi:DUF3291 domain-containing protein [Nocardiopsis sp. CC223A]|uniref:DUF3291 domain-containing protein n=1 Tax=Nocardiopsis sp. CC223A TaxID=3044051 RepID=UPI00278BBC1D|nr:DUF3291 domain-containing protein [Nocardiopsis sp. CC223A]